MRSFIAQIKYIITWHDSCTCTKLPGTRPSTPPETFLEFGGGFFSVYTRTWPMRGNEHPDHLIMSLFPSHVPRSHSFIITVHTRPAQCHHQHRRALQQHTSPGRQAGYCPRLSVRRNAAMIGQRREPKRRNKKMGLETSKAK